MEAAYQIFDYLSLKYKSPSDMDYFAFLVHSVEQNYQAENYHFAVVALHMIYMGIVYHYIYGILRVDPKRFEHVLIGFHNQLEQRGNLKDFSDISWHNFSIINESTIFQFYRTVGFSKDEIKQLKKPVEQRNDILHTNGIYLASENDFEERSQKYLQNLVKIHLCCFNEFKTLLFQFLNEIMIDIENVSEAILYLEEDFIKEFGINLIIIRSLSEISESEYPERNKLFFSAFQEMIETEN